MLFAARFLAAVRAAISLPQSKPRIKATAIALRHPAALHIAGATCAPARSYWFSAAAQSPHAFASKPTLRSCASPVFKGQNGGQRSLSRLCAPGLRVRAGMAQWWRTFRSAWLRSFLSCQCCATLPHNQEYNYQLLNKASAIKLLPEKNYRANAPHAQRLCFALACCISAGE